MPKIYSPSTNTFFDPVLKEAYDASGTWPSDGVEVEDSVFEQFALAPAPEGKVRAAGPDGLPIWEDAPGTVNPAPVTIFATREYLERFTDDEYAAARYSPNFLVQRALDSMIAAGWIDVADPAVAQGLDLMVAEGVIAAERKGPLLEPKAA
jgi:hypothetical protein